MKHARNDPCHCGSGQKYKKCCLPKDEAEASQAKESPSAVSARAPLGAMPFVLAALGLAAALGVGFWRDLSAGLIVASAWALGMLIYLSVRQPPPPREGPDDPAALNFGR
ncbi:SEC-C domain-containing protein [Myxococcota bacterium]|nr:SEC-C domain-containing protein [Myxococcota bacterium]MBU1431190.1 SEC-C domain-containing protein [Myxococcota bacterium]MBU1897875.1 SEC-C domain-containing protein [Myxococcota bacterium]